jgi:hypothetical protein
MVTRGRSRGFAAIRATCASSTMAAAGQALIGTVPERRTQIPRSTAALRNGVPIGYGEISGSAASVTFNIFETSRR